MASDRRVWFFSAATLFYSAYCVVWPYPRVRLVLFAAGIVLWELVHGLDVRTRISGVSEGVTTLAALLLLPALDAVATEAVWFDPDSMARLRVQPVVRALLLWLVALSLVLHAIAREGPLARTLSWTPLRWLGNMSYSYYLSHALAMALAGVRTKTLPLYLALLPISFIGTWVVSTLLFATVEKPFSLRR